MAITISGTGITSAQIQADGIDGSKIADDVINSEHLAAGGIDNEHLATGIDAAKLTGTLPAISGANLTNLNLESIRRDIATLALHSAIADNKAAFNLPNSFIDQFEDDSGLGTQTDVDRNTTSEYVSSITPAVGVNSNTKILLHMDDTSLTDSSGTSVSTTVTGTTRSSAQSKFGGYSALFDGSEYITFANVPAIGSSLWGLDFWWRPTNVTGSGRQTFFAGVTDGQWFAFGLSESDTKLQLEVAASGGNWQSLGTPKGAKNSWNTGQWYHIAIARTSDTNISWYVDGTLDKSQTIASGSISTTGQPRLSEWGGNQSWYIDGYIDEYRMQIGENPLAVAADPLYIASSTFTPPTTAYSAEVASATGTLISTAQTANAAQTKVSGVILYKNEEGTATLGTDLKVYFTCNGGSNWTESTPVAAGTFSTGILMAKCPEVTCTSGTDVRYKVVWANQSSGSKETQLHGIGMNY